MKFSEFTAQIEALKSDRDELHGQLNTLLGNKNMSVAERESAEKAVRGKIRALSDQLYPMEMEKAEIARLVKGLPRKNPDAWIDTEITLG